MSSPSGTQFPGALDSSTSIGTAVVSGNTVLANYVDTQSSAILAMESAVGLQSGAKVWKYPVRLATAVALPANTYASGAQTLTATANAALSVDSVAVAVNDRILVKNELTQSHNGIYVVTQVGDATHPYILTRAADAAASAALPPETAVGVSVGTLNAATTWLLSNAAPVVLDTTALAFIPLVGPSIGAGPAYGTAGGSSNAYTLTLTAPPSAYQAGQSVLFVASFANTGAATLNVNGLGATALTKFGATALISGDIANGQAVWATYDGTQFQMLSTGAIIPAAQGGTGSSSFTQGDLLVASSASALAHEAIGANGQVLTAASSQSNGVQWTASTIGVEQGGTLTATEPNVNFIAGTGMVVTVADNAGSSRADVTLTNIGSGNTGGRFAFGDGSDGNLTFDGTHTILGIAPSSNVYTLNRTILPANMTVNSGVTVATANWMVFVQQSLTNNGTLANNGGNASGLGGGGEPFAGYLPGGSGGSNGGPNFPGGVGTAGGVYGGSGGAGGAGGTTAGGAGGTAPTPTAAQGSDSLPRMWGFWLAGTCLDHLGSTGAGSSGGGGGGETSHYGGGSGAGGGWVIVCARTITGTGTIEANGGNGANGTAGNSGGGGGGGGGMVCVFSESLGGGQTVQALGGTHGNGLGTGVNGVSGSNGLVYTINVS